MGDSVPARASKIQVSKGKLVGVISALAGLIAAATPGYLAYREGAGEKAKAAKEHAEKGHVAAEEADIKAETAYELMKQRMEFLTARDAERKVEILNLQARVDRLMENRHERGRRIASEAPRASRGGGGRGEEGGATGGAVEPPTMADGDGLKGVEEDPIPIQQQALPDSLDGLVQERLEKRRSLRKKR